MVGIGKVGSGIRSNDCLPSCSIGSCYLGGMRFEVSLLRTPLLRPEHEPVLSFWKCPRVPEQ